MYDFLLYDVPRFIVLRYEFLTVMFLTSAFLNTRFPLYYDEIVGLEILQKTLPACNAFLIIKTYSLGKCYKLASEEPFP